VITIRIGITGEESLLELVPEVAADSRCVGVADDSEPLAEPLPELAWPALVALPVLALFLPADELFVEEPLPDPPVPSADPETWA